jgi:hypothetical protein
MFIIIYLGGQSFKIQAMSCANCSRKYDSGCQEHKKKQMINNLTQCRKGAMDVFIKRNHKGPLIIKKHHKNEVAELKIMRWKLNRYLLSIHSIHLSKSLFVLD